MKMIRLAAAGLMTLTLAACTSPARPLSPEPRPIDTAEKETGIGNVPETLPRPETTFPTTTEPVITEPETTEPVTTAPETTEPVITEPETTEPVTTAPETTEPVTSEPETTVPVTTVPVTTAPVTTAPVTTRPEKEPAETRKIEVVNGITYIDGILVVNKTYSLPSDYAPGVDPEAKKALEEMAAAAAKEGLDIYVISGFRSYEKQASVYSNYVKKDGKEAADTYSARPGHSEHQSGLGFDVNSLKQAFGKTKEGQWLAEQSWKYGFILRYPKNKEKQTGFMYEPWHIRYVGREAAEKIYRSGLCLEEYLGITSRYAEE